MNDKLINNNTVNTDEYNAWLDECAIGKEITNNNNLRRKATMISSGKINSYDVEKNF